MLHHRWNEYIKWNKQVIKDKYCRFQLYEVVKNHKDKIVMMVVRGCKRMGLLFNGHSLFYKMKLWGWMMVARDRTATKMYIKNK